MKVQAARSGGVLRIKLCGDMDEYSAPSVRRECDRLIDQNPTAVKIVINLSEVAFMDSTGIGFLIGRYKKAARAARAFLSKPPTSRRIRCSPSAAYIR